MLLKNRSQVEPHVATGRERLEMLAALVETLPPERLSLARWFGFGKGCAVGWAATDPWFRAQGLRLGHSDDLAHCRPEFEHRSDWAAVASFFAITHGEAQRLFTVAGGVSKPEPSVLARRIRDFIAEIHAA